MSVWLGNVGSGLSQITGQISNFTKEVLTEGAEEVDDHPTELKLAKNKIAEQDAVCLSQKSELDKLRAVNAELAENAQSAELQITAVSTEYRELLQQKEEELKVMKAQQHEMMETHSHAMQTLPHSHHSDLGQNAGVVFGGASDNHDLHDVIASQQEINHLQGKVQQLTAQCQHWKHLVTTQGGQSQTEQSHSGNHDATIVNLETKLKDVSQQRSEDVEQHQHQVATLQDVHQQKMATVKRKHKAELDQYESNVKQLEEQLALVDVQGPEEQTTPEDTGKNSAEDAQSTAALQQKVLEYKQQIDDFEMVKSDWQMEKEALEEVLLKLREQLGQGKEQLNHSEEQLRNSREELSGKEEQLRLKEEMLVQLEAKKQKGTSDAPSGDKHQNLQAQLQQREHTIEELTSIVEDRAENVESLELDLDSKERECQQLQSIVSSKDGEIETLQSERELMVVRLQEVDKEKREAVEEVERERQEKDALDESLQELDTQHEEAMGHVLQARDGLLHKNEELKQELVDLQEQLSNSSTLSQQSQESQPIDGNAENEENRVLVQNNEELKKEVNVLQEKLAGTETGLHDKNGVVEQCRVLGQSNEELQKEVGKLKQRLVSMEAQVQVERAGNSDKTNEVMAQLQRALHAQQEKETNVINLEAQCQQFQTQLTESQTMLHTTQKEKQDCVEKIFAQKAQCEQLQTELHGTQSLQHDGDSQKDAKITELQGKCMQLEMEREGIKGLLAAEQDKSAEIAELEGLCQQFHDEQKEMEIKGQEKDDNIALLEDKCIELEADLAQVQEMLEPAMEGQHEKEVKMRELQGRCEQLQAELSDTKSTLQSALGGQQTITDLLEEKGTEISTLQAEVEVLRQANEDKGLMMRKQDLELERLSPLEEQYRQTLQTQRKLMAEADALKVQVKQLESKEATAEVESKTLDVMTDLEAEITSLNEKLHEKDQALTGSSNEVRVMRTEVDRREKEKADLKSKYQEISAKYQEQSDVIQQLEEWKSQHEKYDMERMEKDDIPQQSNGLYIEQQKESLQGTCNGNDTESSLIEHSNNDINKKLNIDELENLRKIISQKDNIILELKNSNGSLLSLLDDKSKAVYGDTTLVELHQLNSEKIALKLEKDQMLSVLNEKTRECSSLKAELHRLMSVVSAEQAAISKLQQDNQQLRNNQQQPSPKPDPNHDMTKEAIKRLSQIIRDKDLEIESLNQKNQTLLQVLQTSSVEGADMSVVLQERDALEKQVLVFQKDREEIIAALSIKHQESLAYHGEVQRLTDILNMLSEEASMHKQQYANILHQFEDKQKALLKSQNEVLNYKQKYQIDNRFSHQQQQRESTPSSDSDDTNNLMSSATASVVNSQEIEQLHSIIASQEQAFAEKDKIMHEKDNLCRDQGKTIAGKQNLLTEKDRLLSEKNSQILKLEEMMASKDSELGSLSKQHENKKFECDSVSHEHVEMKQEFSQLTEKTAAFQQEAGQLREANSKLQLSLQDKVYELSGLQEKITRLSSMVGQQGLDEQGEVTRLMQQTHSMHEQMQALQKDRNQFTLALQQQQAENQDLNSQIQKSQEREQKLSRELERLRNHLLQIEETYTREALEAEEREKDLRNRLAAAEDKVLYSSTAASTANKQASNQVESVQNELETMTRQRDSLLMQLSSAQDSANQYAASLSNLQMVLEQFQQERDVQQVAEIERFQRKLKQSHKEREELQAQLKVMEAELEESRSALEAAHRLSEQLDRKEEMIHALREEVQLRESELEKVEHELTKMTNMTQAKVDKVMVKNLVIGYFHAPNSQRPQVMKVIASVLEFDADQMEQVSGGEGGGWLGGLLKRTWVVPSTPPTTPTKHRDKHPGFDKSFSELFVTFLERESSPQRLMRLPAEQMVNEELQKHHHHNKPQTPKQYDHRTAFNPFSVPLPRDTGPTTLPLHIGGTGLAGGRGSPHEQHPLMKSITPTLPVLTTTATLAPPGSASSPPALAPAQGSGQASANSSGRSTPASSSIVLRDLLQQ